MDTTRKNLEFLDGMRIVRQPDGAWAVVSLRERKWLLTDASKIALHEFIKSVAIERKAGERATAIQLAWDECERITQTIIKSGSADGVDSLSYRTACNVVRSNEPVEMSTKGGGE